MQRSVGISPCRPALGRSRSALHSYSRATRRPVQSRRRGWAGTGEHRSRIRREGDDRCQTGASDHVHRIGVEKSTDWRDVATQFGELAERNTLKSSSGSSSASQCRVDLGLGLSRRPGMHPHRKEDVSARAGPRCRPAPKAGHAHRRIGARDLLAVGQHDDDLRGGPQPMGRVAGPHLSSEAGVGRSNRAQLRISNRPHPVSDHAALIHGDVVEAFTAHRLHRVAPISVTVPAFWRLQSAIALAYRAL